MLLEVDHGVIISMRQIQRIRKCSGVGGREQESTLSLIRQAINEELKGPGSLIGYRSMWYRLRYKYSLIVRRDTVMIMLGVMDPAGGAQRKRRRLKRRVYRSKGPNFLWHCDGYDKMKPYGIAIHGCIDGYSRKILWLEAASTNNNPRCIAHYFITCVKENSGCPQVLRTDRGTENSLLAVIQPMLRHCHSDDFAQHRSHIYGRSTSNQRIEAWWGQLRKQHMEWWLTFFKDLQIEGHFNSSIKHHVDAVRFSFGPLIQKELSDFLNEWNHHRIRSSSMAELPAGIPDILYHFPTLHGVADRLCTVEENIVVEIEARYCTAPFMVVPEFKALTERLMQYYSLNQPRNFEEALELYHIIVCTLDQIFITA